MTLRSISFAGVLSRSLEFTGLSRRIFGDFSNPDFMLRTSFQTTTPLGGTKVQLIPSVNATGGDTSLQCWTKADSNDAERLYMQTSRLLKLSTLGMESVGTGSLAGWEMRIFDFGGGRPFLRCLYDYDYVDMPLGQLKFPATANPSSDANTLDDYEEGTFSPVLTFSTPGDLSVTYSIQFGKYTKIGNKVTVEWAIITSTFTHTTASGSLLITGMPFAIAASTTSIGTITPSGINKVGYTQVQTRLGGGGGTTGLDLMATGMGVGVSAVAVADAVTGASINFRGTISYLV